MNEQLSSEERMAQLDELQSELRAYLPRLAAARRHYEEFKSETAEQELDACQRHAEGLQARFNEALDNWRHALGLTEEELEQLTNEDSDAPDYSGMTRSDLTQDKVSVTGNIDSALPSAIDKIRSIFPSAWLDEDENNGRTGEPYENGLGISLVRGVRPESEFSTIHRMRQSIRLADQFLCGDKNYDHFLGASLLPQLAQLGSKLDTLKYVKGPVAERLDRLWKGTSDDHDSAALELLVAAGCAEMGREVEFLEETSRKSPDLRSHDPFPLLGNRRGKLTP
ncbi:MAG: hypothetical protein AB1744_15095 [Candidatus Zixiibacteriota bacterium]